MAVNGTLNDLEGLGKKEYSKSVVPGNIPPVQDECAHEFNVQTRSNGQKKYDDYKNGEKRYATESGFQKFLDDIPMVEPGTGMIVNEELTTISLIPSVSGLGVNLRPGDDSYNTKMSGSYGVVSKHKDEKTGLDFVGKKIKRKKFHTTEAMIPRHKHVCEVLGLIVESDLNVRLLLSYSGKTLDMFLKHTKLLESQILDLCIQGLEGLKHLSKYRLKHMDIKPNNMCVKVDSNGQLTLVFIDFGTARFSYEDMPRCGFTTYYLSPELCQYVHRKITVKEVSELKYEIDVYAFGLVILFMCSGKHVMEDLAMQSMEKSNSRDKQKQIIKHKYYDMICNDKELGHKAVKKFGIGILEPLLYPMMEYSPKRRSSPEKLLRIAKQIQSTMPQRMVPSYNDGTIFKDKPPEMRDYGTLCNLSRRSGAQNVGFKPKKHSIMGGEPDLGFQAPAGMVPMKKRSKLAEPTVYGNVTVNQAAVGMVSQDIERLPDLPSILYDRVNSALVLPSSGSDKEYLPKFSELLSSEEFVL